MKHQKMSMKQFANFVLDEDLAEEKMFKDIKTGEDVYHYYKDRKLVGVAYYRTPENSTYFRLRK